MDKSVHIELSFKTGGRLQLSERHDRSDDGLYELTELLNHEVDHDLEIELGYSNDSRFRDHVGLYIELHFTHMENPTTNRVFHAYLTSHPDWEQIERLRDFCNVLLTFRAKW